MIFCEPENSKILETKIYKKAIYPNIFNVVISEKVASKLELDLDNPFIEIIELKKGNDLTILSTGALVHEAIKASDFLHKKEGKSVGVIDLYRLKPLPDLDLIILLRGRKRIVTLEEGYLDGGMGSMIGTLIAENKLNIPFLRMGLKNEFCFVYDSREAVLDKYGLTSSKIAKKISSWIR